MTEILKYRYNNSFTSSSRQCYTCLGPCGPIEEGLVCKKCKSVFLSTGNEETKKAEPAKPFVSTIEACLCGCGRSFPWTHSFPASATVILAKEMPREWLKDDGSVVDNLQREWVEYFAGTHRYVRGRQLNAAGHPKALPMP
jgi:hypothetical protein